MFQKVIDGDKNFDLRIADFNASVGDILVLREWDPQSNNYTGRLIEKTITFVLKTKDLKFFDPANTAKYGYIVMSLN